MSLRSLYKLMVWLLIAAVASAAAWLVWERRHPGAVINTQYRDLKELAQPSRGSVLRAGGPAVEYVPPPSANAVRILSNANMQDIAAARREFKRDPTRRWQYTLEVEETLADGTRRRAMHQFRRDLTEVVLPDGKAGSGSFYLERDAPAPLVAAPLRLDFAGAARPIRVTVRLLAAEPGIADVLLRVATPEPLAQRSAEVMWRRLSDDQRRRLASGNLYPPDLLAEQERANLLASRWRPLGPSGQVTARDIYVLDIDDRGAVVHPPKAAFQKAGPGRMTVVQLPEAGARVRIELEALDVDGQPEPASVRVRWAGHSAFLRSQASYPWQGSEFAREDRYGGGWLEIGSDRDAAVRVRQLDAGEPVDITPPVRFLRAWAVDANAPVELLVSHAGSAATPLRLVLRRIGAQGTAPNASPVQVSLLGADGEVLRQLSLPMQPPKRKPLAWSQYDGLWPEVPGALVTDPVDAFLRLPPGVSRVRIAASEPLLVNGYSRPADLARAVRTPEDSAVPEAATTAIPAWFNLQPDDAEARTLNGLSRLLTIQQRLPDERPDLLAGVYQWESFTPRNDAAGRVFLAPREEGVPDRIEGLGGTFRPVPPSGQALFLADPGRVSVPVRLAWASDSARTFDYAVTVDGSAWVSGAASGHAGEVALPALTPGPHRLAIQADAGVRWFASHTKDGTPWVKRLAFRFDKPLQFEMDRTVDDEEFLSVRVFRPAGIKGRLRVRVAVDGPASPERVGPFPGWLFNQRIHDVRPSGQMALPVAETAGEKADAGQPFYIPIPEGAPRGRYRLTLSPEGGASWVSASRITAGALPKPTLIIESVRNGE